MANKIKNYCHYCNHDTWHEVLNQTERSAESTDEFWWHTDYQIVKCCGCDSISFRMVDIDETMINSVDENGDLIPNIYTYPHRKGAHRELETWAVPSGIRRIYHEVIKSLNEGCYCLAAAGCRAIVEGVCNEEGITGKNLDTKINNLRAKSLITQKDRDRLHAIRFMGNDSIHQLKKPDPDELNIVVEIIEQLLNQTYILEDRFHQLNIKPINTIEELIKLLDEKLQKRTVGQIDILYNLLEHERRIISEDLSRFESELQSKINDGSYTKLSICPPPAKGKQQYKIESI